MKLIGKIIFLLICNLIALWIAVYFVAGFSITQDIKSYLMVAVALTALNLFLKPLLKLFLGPIIIITLGLGIIIINAIILYLLDYFLVQITISGLYPLIYATLIISVINLVFHFSAKRAYN